jgi:NADP-dependent 3-hydroxy acid dehydrogenase YdfG
MRNKVIVITGASAGIGAALAKLCAARGAKVALLARRETELRAIADQCGAGALAVVTDVTRRVEIERAVAQVVARFGHVDVWVNNAGRGITRPVSELSEADFDEMMLVNVKSVLWCMQAVLPLFKQRGEGQIVNVSSMLGRVPFAPFRSAYSASKHALNALTAMLRMELRAIPGIRVTSVHPGVVTTEFGKNALHGGPDSRSLPGAQSADEVAAVIASAIEQPRADVYTLPQGQRMVVDYYAAEDMAAAEARFGGAPPRQP